MVKMTLKSLPSAFRVPPARSSTSATVASNAKRVRRDQSSRKTVELDRTGCRRPSSVSATASVLRIVTRSVGNASSSTSRLWWL